MATRGGHQNVSHNWDTRPVTSNNPFNHIPFSQADLSGYTVGGGSGTEFVEVDEAYRTQLLESLNLARQTLAASVQQYPSTLTNLVFRLRDVAIAKSHRPLTLVAESNLIPAGHGALNEMIVGEIPSSSGLLDYVIQTRNTKAIRANLSAILQIEPWSRQRRNPEGLDRLREQGTALVRLFRYRTDDATIANLNSITALLNQIGATFDWLPQPRSVPLLHLTNLDQLSDEVLDRVLEHPGIRLIFAEPMYAVPVQALNAVEPEPGFTFPAPAEELPTVGVFDTGCDPGSQLLRPWIDGRIQYVLPPETNFVHGTAVSSLVAASAALNYDHVWFPGVGSKVFDVAALEAAGSSFGVLAERLRDALRQRPDIRVWNLSLGASCPCGEAFSTFGQKLDELSDEFNVLFVVAAGNYTETPHRGWPDTSLLSDQISEPADSVRALSVGSMTHLETIDCLVRQGAPAPYSRRGPGPIFTPKPDIVHLGGGVHSPWAVGSASTRVLFPHDQISNGFGTSYAAPIAASMAAQAWRSIDGHPHLSPSPSMIKALMIHAAHLSSPEYSALERRYFGAGLPQDIMSVLYDSDDSFTLIFEAQVVPGPFRWRKAPYPIPNALIQNGKFVGEIIITAAYAPPLSADAGAEYVRANVELSFGILEGDRIKSKVPLEREPGGDTLEKAQIENGGKWAPVKLHRARFPKGVSGDSWALQAQCSLRAFEPSLAEPITVIIAVTLRSLDGDESVHASGLNALAATNWVSTQLPVHVPPLTT